MKGIDLINSDVHNRLRAKILTFELKPGTRLVEDELTAALNAGRTPVREALLRLQGEGLVSRERGWIVEGEPDPDATAPALTGRRGKVVYRLTAEGKERLAELLAEAGPAAYDDEGFGVHFAFFALTDADVRLRILEGRRRRVEERRDGLRAALARTREKLDRYTLQLQEHGLDAVEREVRWLNELIDPPERKDTSR